MRRCTRSPGRDRWNAVYPPCTVAVMDQPTAVLVVGPARVLDDLLELARLASRALGDDALARELKASAAAVRSEFLADPLEG